MNHSTHNQPLPGVPAEHPVPFNLWATHTNKWFYNGLKDPLRAFRTLGSADTLLPAAYASDLRQEALGKNISIHEIGSGNFFFCKAGHDTLIIARIRDLDLNSPEELMEHFAEAARTLCPDAEVSEWTIASLRILRSDADRIASKLGKTYRYQDGSFHFCAVKN